nr:MAG TPA: HNH endonuclease bacteriophage, HNH Endonuclease, DNA.52A [Caudoviricetes sp.]
MKTTIIRTYSELVKLDNFLDRFEYLKLSGVVGAETFGFDRYLNQALYSSPEWKKSRRNTILRDNGCDLGLEDYPLDRALVHHMNPITLEQIENRDPIIFDEEFLITVSHNTHNAIHYGDQTLLPKPLIERRPGDTLLWRRLNER